ncbi:hypothetical protein N656DRAFT_653207 [Canariomyces notabilis]|uniref:Uncharacterized protein n=1 Tax=Canariomyces notabilis TaxID=2074819 RepID=A0AAN6TFA1_9PEZI|nr:hypothetical protein N656DRAFT_653207 [Canariomyces arenarius]
MKTPQLWRVLDPTLHTANFHVDAHLLQCSLNPNPVGTAHHGMPSVGSLEQDETWLKKEYLSCEPSQHSANTHQPPKPLLPYSQ